MMVIIDYPFGIILLSDLTTMCEYQKDSSSLKPAVLSIIPVFFTNSDKA